MKRGAARLRLAARPMFARRLRDKPEEPTASSVLASGMMKT